MHLGGKWIMEILNEAKTQFGNHRRH